MFGIDLWSTLRTPLLREKVEILKVLLQGNPVHKFGQNITGVILARDAMEREVTLSEAILDPKVSCVEVPNFAEAAAAAHPHSSDSISLDGNGPVETQIVSDRLQARSCACTTTYAPPLPQLCFS